MIAASQHPYGAALLELTEEQNATDTVVEQCRQLAELIDSDDTLRTMLQNPSLSIENRRGVLKAALEGRVHDSLYRLIQVMNQKGRAAYIGHMCRSFVKLVDQHRGVVEVDAYVASELDDATAGRVRDQLGAALGGKQVHLNLHVDPSIIGGLKVRIGDKLIDGSVAARLRRMRETLITRGREMARSA